MYFRARMYESQTGEFISQDPLEYIDGMSLYRGYFAQSGVDPTGTDGIAFETRENAVEFIETLGKFGAKHVKLYIGSSMINENQCEPLFYAYTDFRDRDAVFEYADVKYLASSANEVRNKFLLASGALPNKDDSDVFPADQRARFSYQDAQAIASQIEDDPEFVLDIGGEGRNADAININIDDKTSTPGPTNSYKRGDSIKLLFMINGNENELPFKTNSASKIISQNSAFFANPYPTEVPRILEPSGAYHVWHGEGYLGRGISVFKQANPGMKHTELRQVNPGWFGREGAMYFSSLTFD